MLVRNNLLLLSLTSFIASCSAQIHLGGAAGFSKSGTVSPSNQEQQPAGAQDVGDATPVVPQQYESQPGQPANQEVSNQEAPNPYTTEATRPKEIAGSFLTDLVCEFSGSDKLSPIDKISCTLFEVKDGQKLKVERAYKLKAVVVIPIKTILVGRLESNYVTTFDIGHLIEKFPNVNPADLKVDVTGDLNGATFTPNIKLNVLKCTRPWILKKKSASDTYAKLEWEYNQDAKVKVLSARFSASASNDLSGISVPKEITVYHYSAGYPRDDDDLEQDTDFKYSWSLYGIVDKIEIYKKWFGGPISYAGDLELTMSVTDASSFSCQNPVNPSDPKWVFNN